jgi:hypothetical protein
LANGLLIATFGAEELSPKNIISGQHSNGESQEARTNNNHKQSFPEILHSSVFEDLQSSG